LALAFPILHTTLGTRPPDREGKVRDIFDFEDRLLVVASDRISAFDYVLGSGIPDKGKVLSQISAFWFQKTAGLVANHLISSDPADFPDEARAHADLLRGRSMLVRRTEPLAIECVARGYLSGSGWKDYVATGEVCGIRLPAGLRESDRLPEPLFTPATKAAFGEHDENVSYAAVVGVVGAETAGRLRELTLAVYARAEQIARERGIILADTKLEFGARTAGTIVLADEVLTPDSSRFWPADDWQPGRTQTAFDKQIVRNWLLSPESGWDRSSGEAPPPLPQEVIDRTRSRYIEAFERLTGQSF
jgi:phosphoribosylaminoimidazole-succinocarboxamide synthase